jgi:hypothetical protein
MKYAGIDYAVESYMLPLDVDHAAELANLHPRNTADIVGVGIVIARGLNNEFCNHIGSFVQEEDDEGISCVTIKTFGDFSASGKDDTFSPICGWRQWEQPNRATEVARYWVEQHLRDGVLVPFRCAETLDIVEIVAILSTTVLPLDGTYKITTIDPGSVNVTGVPHYIWHPDTKAIVEAMGAIPAETKLFSGLQSGQSAFCFSIAQGKSTRVVDGFTTPHQTVTAADLTCRIITRVDGN